MCFISFTAQWILSLSEIWVFKNLHSFCLQKHSLHTLEVSSNVSVLQSPVSRFKIPHYEIWPHVLDTKSEAQFKKGQKKFPDSKNKAGRIVCKVSYLSCSFKEIYQQGLSSSYPHPTNSQVIGTRNLPSHSRNTPTYIYLTIQNFDLP